MYIDLKRPLTVLKVVGGQTFTHVLQPGMYLVEVIDTPLDHGQSQWIVLLGTKIGASTDHFDNERIERIEGQPPIKAIIIDDDGGIIKALKRAFKDRPDIAVIECHTVGEALTAIKERNPAFIFLDHNLTPNGSEGFKIVEELKASGTSAKIYSTTMDPDVISKYQENGVGHIEKTNVGGMAELIK